MASQSKSRWGSFLQQAVAGVESRLDTILADDDTASIPVAKSNGTAAGQPVRNEQTSLPTAPRSSGDLSRRSSTGRKNDRLQERLAKAVVNRTNVKSASSSTLPSRTASPPIPLDSPRRSVETNSEELQSGLFESKLETEESKGPANKTPAESDDNAASIDEEPLLALKQDAFPTNSFSIDSSESKSARPSLESIRSTHNEHNVASSDAVLPVLSHTNTIQYEKIIEQMRSDYEAAELRRQEEIHQYLENIDALQAKLQYLTKEATELARSAANEAQRGSTEEKIALKDEKIALLMEEGQKLSQTELKHMNTIRKLRAKSAEDDKRLIQSQKTAEEFEKTGKLAQEKVKRAEALQREAQEKVRALQKWEQELERVRSESDSKASIISDLQTQLTKVKTSGAAEEASRYKDLFEAQRKATSDLKDDLSNAKIEKELSDERHRVQIREVQEKADHEKERSKIADLELRGEIRVLESRLETFRARAEEVSSGSTGITQAKLLRQIETLQTQYSVASENWRGIESSLLARIAGLEKERDDLSKKEAEVRRKARENGSKSRRYEEQLEQAISRMQEMEDELSSQNRTLINLQEALAQAEAEQLKTQKDYKSEREALEARLASFETDRRESILQTPDIPYPQIRTDSLVPSSHKKSKTGRASPHGRRHPGLGLSGSPQMSFPELSVSRRASTQHSQGSATPHRQDSLPLMIQSPVNIGVPETPYLHIDELFDGAVTPATPDRTINDMFSVSTAAAGPSVQLVERMSAAVRRLESEKAATKDELDRLSAQRDEARDQVFALMREIEEKRAFEGKIASLEAEVAEINQRYQTTLEMLGEKSELVEELQADVADVKQMYRDLVENTMK